MFTLRTIQQVDSNYPVYVTSTIDHLLKAVTYGSKSFAQALPRLLTVWFEFASLAQVLGNVGGGGRNSLSQHVNKCTAKIETAKKLIPAHLWWVS
jgi:hypothetical protein